MVFLPTMNVSDCFQMDDLSMGENDHFSREVCPGSFRPQPLQHLGLWPSALCLAPMYSCQAAQPASQGAGEAGGAPGRLCSYSLGKGCRRTGSLRASWPPPVHKPRKSGWTACFPFSVSPWSLVQLAVEANTAGTNSPSMQCCIASCS